MNYAEIAAHPAAVFHDLSIPGGKLEIVFYHTCLKGTMSEFELDVLRQRAWKARHEKALRGSLVIAVPVGFITTDIGTTAKDPDLRVQEAVMLVFRKFRELGSVRQTLFWFLTNGLQLPARHWDGQRWVTV